MALATLRGAAPWFVLGAALLGFILVPFALAGNAFAAWSDPARLETLPFTALAMAGLLAADIFLPVPSSVIATFAGWRFGALEGALLNTVGLCVGTALGYAMGRTGLAPFTRHVLDAERQAALRETFACHGAWTVVLCRGIPVLAEASVLLAGAAAMPLPRFALAAGLSNLVLGSAYAAAGAASPAWAAAAALGLPALAIAFAALARRNRSHPSR